MVGVPDWVIDDPFIAAPARFLRRVHWCTVHDGAVDRSTFEEQEEGQGLSVTLWTAPSDLNDVQRFNENLGVICFDVAVLRAIAGVVICRVPLVGNLNHCEVYPGLAPAARKACKNNYRWVYYPNWVKAEHRGQVEVF